MRGVVFGVKSSDEIKIHIDENNLIQTVVVWLENGIKSRKMVEFRVSVKLKILRNKFNLSEHYGDWDYWAENILSYIEEELPTLQTYLNAA